MERKAAKCKKVLRRSRRRTSAWASQHRLSPIRARDRISPPARVPACAWAAKSTCSSTFGLYDGLSQGCEVPKRWRICGKGVDWLTETQTAADSSPDNTGHEAERIKGMQPGLRSRSSRPSGDAASKRVRAESASLVLRLGTRHCPGLCRWGLDGLRKPQTARTDWPSGLQDDLEGRVTLTCRGQHPARPHVRGPSAPPCWSTLPSCGQEWWASVQASQRTLPRAQDPAASSATSSRPRRKSREPRTSPSPTSDIPFLSNKLVDRAPQQRC